MVMTLKETDRNQEQAMQAYCREGTARAMTLGNRGPIRFTADGNLRPEIIEAYERCGFYVFEGVVSAAELAELEADFRDVLSRLPATPDSKLDPQGRSALGSDHDAPALVWAKPLSDPFGGTGASKGRHPIKMYEPEPAPGLPDMIVSGILGSLQYSDAILRLYAHPELLRAAAAINGDDFVPFSEAIAIKKPGEGPSVAWHQDGMTHWNSPDWDQGSHGFNMMVQLYGSTAANGVWYLPGSQTKGKLDIQTIAHGAGSDRLPNAVPLICKPGDVCVSNRQAVHGSFANNSPDWRVTFNMGFLRRRSVLDVVGRPFMTKHDIRYDADVIRNRAKMIGYAIDARHCHFPVETPFVYRPHAEAGEVYRWDEQARPASRGYNSSDLIV